jgi:tetratricopeptide (TPR) repeat protein
MTLLEHILEDKILVKNLGKELISENMKLMLMQREFCKEDDILNKIYLPNDIFLNIMKYVFYSRFDLLIKSYMHNNPRGENAILIASKYGIDDIVSILLDEYGIDPNIPKPYHNRSTTPLSFIINTNNLSTIELLIQKGAKTNFYILESLSVKYLNDNQHHKFFQISEQMLSISDRGSHNHSVSLRNIGIYYQTMERYENSIENFEKELEIVEKLGETHRFFTINHDIGYSYMKLKKHKEALYYLIKALDLGLNSSDKHMTIIDTYYCIGISFFYNNNFDEGIKYLKRALEFYQPMIETNHISGFYHLMANCFFFQKNYNECITYSQKTLDIREKAQQTYLNEEGQFFYTNLSLSYLYLGFFEEAYKYSTIGVQSCKTEKTKIRLNEIIAIYYLYQNRREEAHDIFCLYTKKNSYISSVFHILFYSDYGINGRKNRNIILEMIQFDEFIKLYPIEKHLEIGNVMLKIPSIEKEAKFWFEYIQKESEYMKIKSRKIEIVE